MLSSLKIWLYYMRKDLKTVVQILRIVAIKTVRKWFKMTRNHMTMKIVQSSADNGKLEMMKMPPHLVVPSSTLVQLWHGKSECQSFDETLVVLSHQMVLIQDIVEARHLTYWSARSYHMQVTKKMRNLIKVPSTTNNMCIGIYDKLQVFSPLGEVVDQPA